MKLVSFHTPDEYYSAHAVNLKQQCDSLGIVHHIVKKSYGDSWIDNCRAKPSFLRDTLVELKEPFIWLDIDCRVLKPIDFEIDPGTWGITYARGGRPYDHVHYVPYNNKTLRFLDLWEQTIVYKGRGSHSALVSIIGSIKTQELPPGYFEIGLAETESKTAYFKDSK